MHGFFGDKQKKSKNIFFFDYLDKMQDQQKYIEKHLRDTTDFAAFVTKAKDELAQYSDKDEVAYIQRRRAVMMEIGEKAVQLAASFQPSQITTLTSEQVALLGECDEMMQRALTDTDFIYAVKINK
jgi:hypothetical protein